MAQAKIDGPAPKNVGPRHFGRRWVVSNHRVEDERDLGGLLRDCVPTRAMAIGQCPSTDTLTVKPAQEELEVSRPPMWRVMLKNDDFTSFEFVMLMLMDHFGHSEPSAEKIAEDVHFEGFGIAGIFSKDIAETKVDKVMQLAASNGFPLKAIVDRTL